MHLLHFGICESLLGIVLCGLGSILNWLVLYTHSLHDPIGIREEHVTLVTFIFILRNLLQLWFYAAVDKILLVRWQSSSILFIVLCFEALMFTWKIETSKILFAAAWSGKASCSLLCAVLLPFYGVQLELAEDCSCVVVTFTDLMFLFKIIVFLPISFFYSF